MALRRKNSACYNDGRMMGKLRRTRPLNRFPRTALILAALLLSLLLLGPFLIPVPPLKDTVPPEQLADPESRFADLNSVKVHYKLAGSGQPVLVLLHGLGASTWSWREVMTPLAQFGTVVAFDRPAFGLTERPLPGEWKGDNPYTAEAQVRLTVALLDKLGAQKAVLVGNSAGGAIAMLTALHFPERVQALILVSPAIYGGGGIPAWARPLLEIPQLRHLGPLLVRFLIARLERSLPTAWHDPSKIGSEVLAGYRKPLQAKNWDRAFWQFTLAGRPLNLEGQLDRITIPTLVISGDDDRWVPTAQSVRLAGELPNAELALIPDCGHVAQEECPEEFMESVTAFLSGLP
jgi:pimeloyl-ACP methyl ester carboxylesterase